MTSRSALFIALCALLACVLLIGAWCARRTRNVDDFHLAGRTLGGWRVGLSQAAGAYGLWILIGVSGAAYTLGLAAAWIGIGVLAGAALAWFYVGPGIHSQARMVGATTAFELLGQPGSGDASRSTAQSAAGIAAVAVFFGICAQFSIAGSAVARVLAIHQSTAVFIVAGGTLAGALLAGSRAISAIGALSALLIVAVAVFLPLPSFFFLGGVAGLKSALAATGELALDPLAGHAGAQAALFVMGSFGIGLGLCGQPQLIDAFIATRSVRAIRGAGAIALAWFALVLLGMLLLGWSARALYESIDSADVVLFELVQRILPPSLLALPVLAVVAAVVTAIGAQLVIMSDALVLLTSRTETGPPTTVRLRTAVLLAGGAATVIASLASLDSARVALLCWLATAAVLGPLFLVRASGVHVRAGFAAAAMRIGIVLTLLLFLLRRERTEWLAAVLPFTAALAVAVFGRDRK
jgi:Na+/proline symporter